MTRIISVLGPPPWLTTTLESAAARNAWSYDSTGMTRGIHDAIVSRLIFYPPEAVAEPMNGVWALEARNRHFTITNALHQVNGTASRARSANPRDQADTNGSHPTNGSPTPENTNHSRRRTSSSSSPHTADNHNNPRESLQPNTEIPPGNDNNTENQIPMNGIHQMDGSHPPADYNNLGNGTSPDDSNQTRGEHEAGNLYIPANHMEELPTATHPFVSVGGLRLPLHGLRGRDFVMRAHAPSDREAKCSQTVMEQPYCFGQWYEREGPILFIQFPAITCNFILCCDGLYRSHQGEILQSITRDREDDQEVYVNGTVHD